MNDSQPRTNQDETQPVAYDADGKPLYAAPTITQRSDNQNGQVSEVHQYVHVSRAVEPRAPEVSPETRKRHEESVAAFPELNLSDHEYIISFVKRHPIGMVPAILTSGVLISLTFTVMFNYPELAEQIGLSARFYGLILLIGFLLIMLFAIGGYAAIWVYMRNSFFLTNESVIQEIQTSLFSRTEQTVSLLNIEDASFHQTGPLQSILNYGSIRLSTEGDETTYRFSYVSNPKRQLAILNNAVEAFKTGRPVAQDSQDD